MANEQFGTPLNVSLSTSRARTALKELITAVQSAEKHVQDFGARVDISATEIAASFGRIQQQAVTTSASISQSFNQISFAGLEGKLTALQAQLAGIAQSAVLAATAMRGIGMPVGAALPMGGITRPIGTGFASYPAVSPATWQRTIAEGQAYLGTLPPHLQRLVSEVGPYQGLAGVSRERALARNLVGGSSRMGSGYVGLTPRELLSTKRTIPETMSHEIAELMRAPGIVSINEQRASFERMGLVQPSQQREYREALRALEKSILSRTRIPMRVAPGELIAEQMGTQIRTGQYSPEMQRLMSIMSGGTEATDIFGIGRRFGRRQAPIPPTPPTFAPRLSATELEQKAQQWFVDTFGAPLPRRAVPSRTFYGLPEEGMLREFSARIKAPRVSPRLRAGETQDAFQIRRALEIQQAQEMAYPITRGNVRLTPTGELEAGGYTLRRTGEQKKWIPEHPFRGFGPLPPGVQERMKRDIYSDIGLTKPQDQIKEYADASGRVLRQTNKVWNEHGKQIRGLTRDIDPVTGAVTEYGFKTQQAMGMGRNAWGRHAAYMAQGTLLWLGFGTVIFGAISQMQRAFTIMSQLEVSQARVGFIMGRPTAQAEYVTQAAMEIGRRTGVSPVQIAGTFEESAQATKNVREQYMLMDAAAKLSVVSGMSVEETQKRLVAIVRQSGQSFSDLPSILDAVAAAYKRANVPMQEIIQMMAEGGALAETWGLDVSDLTVFVAATAEATNKSADEIKAMLAMAGQRIFQGPQAEKLFGATGVGVFEAGTFGEKRRPIIDILDEIAKKWGQLNKTQRQEATEALTGVRNANYAVMGVLLGHFSQIQEKMQDAAKNQTGSFNQLYGGMADTLDRHTARMGASWEAFLSKLGNTGVAKAAIDTLKASFDAMGETVERIDAKSTTRQIASYGSVGLGGITAGAAMPGPWWLKILTGVGTAAGIFTTLGRFSPPAQDQLTTQQREIEQQIESLEMKRAGKRTMPDVLDMFGKPWPDLFARGMGKTNAGLRSLHAYSANSRQDTIDAELAQLRSQRDFLIARQEFLRMLETEKQIESVGPGRISDIPRERARAIGLIPTTVREPAAGERAPREPRWIDITQIGKQALPEVERIAAEIMAYNERVFGVRVPETQTETAMLYNTKTSEKLEYNTRSLDALSQALGIYSQTIKETRLDFQRVSRTTLDSGGIFRDLVASLQGKIEAASPQEIENRMNVLLWDERMRTMRMEQVNPTAFSMAQQIFNPISQRLANPSFTSLKDLTPNQLSRLMPTAQSWMQKIEAISPGYIDANKDNLITVLTKTNDILGMLGITDEALRLATEELTDTNKGMLRGFYNLPAGYSPPTVWDFYNKNQNAARGPINYPWLQQPGGDMSKFLSPEQIRDLIAKQKADALAAAQGMDFKGSLGTFNASTGKFSLGVDKFDTSVDKLQAYIDSLSIVPGTGDTNKWQAFVDAYMIPPGTGSTTTLPISSIEPYEPTFIAPKYQSVDAYDPTFVGPSVMYGDRMQAYIDAMMTPVAQKYGEMIASGLGSFLGNIGDFLGGGWARPPQTQRFGYYAPVDPYDPTFTSPAASFSDRFTQERYASYYTPSLEISSSREEQLMLEAARIALASGLGIEGAKVAQAILVTEGGMTGAVGDQGQSFGPLQFYKYGQLPNYANAMGVPLDQAGQYAIRNPESAITWALQTYLGDAIKRGMAEGLSGSDLATYVQRYGQVSVNPEMAGQNYAALFGSGQAGSLAFGPGGDKSINVFNTMADHLSAIRSRLNSLDTAPWAIIQTASNTARMVSLLESINANTSNLSTTSSTSTDLYGRLAQLSPSSLET